MPGVIGVYLTGTPMKGVGPQDIALAIIGEVFDKGYVKNKSWSSSDRALQT